MTKTERRILTAENAKKNAGKWKPLHEHRLQSWVRDAMRSGSKHCACGKTISRTAVACAACVQSLEALP